MTQISLRQYVLWPAGIITATYNVKYKNSYAYNVIPFVNHNMFPLKGNWRILEGNTKDQSRCFKYSIEYRVTQNCILRVTKSKQVPEIKTTPLTQMEVTTFEEDSDVQNIEYDNYIYIRFY